MSKLKNYYHDEICDRASEANGEMRPEIERSNGGLLYQDKHYYLTNGSFYSYGVRGSHLERLRDAALIEKLREFINQENLCKISKN